MLHELPFAPVLSFARILPFVLVLPFVQMLRLAIQIDDACGIQPRDHVGRRQERALDSPFRCKKQQNLP